MRPERVRVVRFYWFLFNLFTSTHFCFDLVYGVRSLMMALMPAFLIKSTVLHASTTATVSAFGAASQPSSR